MKKEMLILITLLFGLSFKSFASTGNANDGLVFILVLVGLLFIIIGLLSGIDYLQKNVKKIIYNFMSFLIKKVSLLRNYLNKLKSNLFDPSYL